MQVMKLSYLTIFTTRVVNELVSSLFIEVNPIPVKAAMNLMGMEAGELRLPLTNISEQNLEILRNNMMKYGIKVD